MNDMFSEVRKAYGSWAPIGTQVETFGSSGVQSANSENSRTSSSSSNGGSNNGSNQRSEQQFPKGCSKTIFLPAERTGAVIGKKWTNETFNKGGMQCLDVNKIGAL